MQDLFMAVRGWLASSSRPQPAAQTVHVDLSNAEFEALRIMAESDGLTVEEAVQEAVRGELQAFFETENASEWTEEQAVLAGEARKRHTSPSALRGSLP
jgi:hypothetical protein